MENEKVKQLNQQYDDCIKKVVQLTQHIKLFSKQNQLENLEEIVVPEQYLTLLANSLYAINSLAYSYCNVKNTTFPPEFAKVQQYYNKAKNPLTSQPRAQPSVVVDKQAAKRVIRHSLN